MIIFTDFFTLKPEHSSLWGRYRSTCTEDVRQTALRGSRADRTELQAASLPSQASSSQEKRNEGPGGNDAADLQQAVDVRGVSPVAVQGDPQCRVAPVLLQDAPRVLELIGHEQELAPREPPDVKFAEVLKLAVDLLLADPRPLPDGEDEDGGADARGVWARKVLEDREGKQKRFPTAPMDGPPTQLVLEGREKRFPTAPTD